MGYSDRSEWLPVADVRPHLKALIASGWGYDEIARAVYSSRHTIKYISMGQRVHVSATIGEAILNLKPKSRYLPVLPFRRRVIMAGLRGYSAKRIADLAGMHHTHLWLIQKGRYHRIGRRIAVNLDAALTKVEAMPDCTDHYAGRVKRYTWAMLEEAS